MAALALFPLRVISDEDLPGHDLWRRIQGIVRRNPGIRYRELQRRVGAPNGVFDHHLDFLLDADFVAPVRIRGRTHFFDADLRGPLGTSTLTEREHQLLGFLRVEPGATEGDIVRALGLSQGRVSAHMHRLQSEGWVRSRRMGHQLRWDALR